MVFLLGCNSDPLTEMENEVPLDPIEAEFRGYVDRFFEEAEKRGLSLSRDELAVSYTHLTLPTTSRV